MTNSCKFCDFKNSKKHPHESAFFYLLFDNYPVTPGHALIIPKRHIESITDLNTDEWQDLQSFINTSIELIEKTDLTQFYTDCITAPTSETSARFCKEALDSPFLKQKPDGYNHGVNNGRSAGQTIFHLHWHIIPRFSGDMKHPEGGVRNVIPEKGNYKIY